MASQVQLVAALLFAQGGLEVALGLLFSAFAGWVALGRTPLAPRLLPAELAAAGTLLGPGLLAVGVLKIAAARRNGRRSPPPRAR